MMHCLSSMSKKVHEDDDHQQNNSNKSDEGASTSLTVWNKSLVFSCNGFTVINSNGDLVYRVDNYVRRRREEVVILMDGLGDPILSVRRCPKKLGLLENWLMYEGDVGDKYFKPKSLKKPLCYVKKYNSILNANSSVLAHVFRDQSTDKLQAYVIEGSYAHRSCKVFDKSRNVVAEIKRKEAMVDGVSFGTDVFVLVVHHGFDQAFAMALILLLDQMF